jgi:hypothetical protein
MHAAGSDREYDPGTIPESAEMLGGHHVGLSPALPRISTHLPAQQPIRRVRTEE